MSNSLSVIETMPGVELFAPGKYRDILDGFKADVRAVPVDISTPSGREKCASLAYQVGKTKNAIDKKRKALVEDEKKRLKAIDAEGSRIWDELEDLQKEVRKPLTDWENAEKDRVAAHESALAAIPESSMYGATETAQDILPRLEYLSSLYASRDWQEFSARAKQAIDAEITRTRDIMERVKSREAEAAELVRLRAEAAEREQRERDERIAQQAREAAERTAEAERKRIEAEAARIKQAESDRIAAEERHAREKVEAIEAERARQEAETKRLKEEAEARERNKQHAAKINREVRDALKEHVSEEQATAIVKAIASGTVPHTKISY